LKSDSLRLDAPLCSHHCHFVKPVTFLHGESRYRRT
jgi:hypothetical protein